MCRAEPRRHTVVLYPLIPSQAFVKRLKPTRKAAMLGLAFDAEDGHTRITKGDNFVLCGGSQETHAVIQETAVKINERLDQRGKRLEDVSFREFSGIARDVWQQVTGDRPCVSFDATEC